MFSCAAQKPGIVCAFILFNMSMTQHNKSFFFFNIYLAWMQKLYKNIAPPTAALLGLGSLQGSQNHKPHGPALRLKE